MKRLFLFGFLFLLPIFLPAVDESFPPIIGPIPDIWIGDDEDNLGSPSDLNFFRFSHAFNFDIYVSGYSFDTDFRTTEIRWSFLADSPGLITINGIDAINDETEVLNPQLFGKELTRYPNNNPIGLTGRETSWADFWDIKDSPPGEGPPWPDPDPENMLNEVITIYASNGEKWDSRQILVVAGLFDWPTPNPPHYTWLSPGNEGWTKSQVPDGTFINAVDGAFYIAAHSTSEGSVAITGRETSSPEDPGAYGLWESPSDEIPYFPWDLYRIEYKIRTDQANPDKVPNCRLFADFIDENDTKLFATGGNRVGRGIFAPSPGGKDCKSQQSGGERTPPPAGDTFNVYLKPTDLPGTVGAEYLRVKFELIDFSVEEEGILYLDRVDISRWPEEVLSNKTEQASFEPPFTGWQSLIMHDIMPVFGEATAWSDAVGLALETPQAFTSPAIHYASWSLPPESSGVYYESGILYQAVYTLQKDSPSDNPGKIRLINQNTQGNWVSILALIPDYATDHMPGTSGEQYSVWFEGMPELYSDWDKNRMSFQFDVSDGSNSQHGTVYLTGVKLNSYAIP